MDEKPICENCKFFTRQKWHKSIDVNEGEQMGGRCKVLCKVLVSTNSVLWMQDSIHVQKSFGCIMFRAKSL